MPINSESVTPNSALYLKMLLFVFNDNSRFVEQAHWKYKKFMAGAA